MYTNTKSRSILRAIVHRLTRQQESLEGLSDRKNRIVMIDNKKKNSYLVINSLN